MFFGPRNEKILRMEPRGELLRTAVYNTLTRAHEYYDLSADEEHSLIQFLLARRRARKQAATAPCAMTARQAPVKGVCSRCHGAGVLHCAEPECNGGRLTEPCDRCDGTGRVTIMQEPKP